MTKAICELCGEPMPTGEEMFNYHGYSGPCPTPTKASTKEITPEVQAAEERMCTCGAGHGSLEGHTNWCAWVAAALAQKPTT